jgi:hypothetical protein
MRPVPLLLVAAAALALLWIGGATTPAASSPRATAVSSPFLPSPPLGPPRRIVFYGNVVSLGRAAGRWILRVDPAAFLSGITAQRAAVEAGAIGPGEPVPNDHYVVNESTRPLTYIVAPAARITVITAGVRATRVSVGELAALVGGRNPRKRKLFGDPKTGYWVQARGDTVLSLDQQYRP